MTRLLIGLILLTGCSSYHKTPMTFLSPETINFAFTESDQPNKIRYTDTIIIHNLDTIIVGEKYSEMKQDVNFQNSGLFSTYLFLSNDRSIYDDVFLTYYDQKLFSVSIFSKDTARVDSFSRVLESFYNKKFKGVKGSFRTDRLSIDKNWHWTSSETQFRILNNRVSPPPFCNSTKWYDYLAFWRWF